MFLSPHTDRDTKAKNQRIKQGELPQKSVCPKIYSYRSFYIITCTDIATVTLRECAKWGKVFVPLNLQSCRAEIFEPVILYYVPDLPTVPNQEP